MSEDELFDRVDEIRPKIQDRINEDYATGQVVKRGRGRPKGSKNKPKIDVDKFAEGVLRRFNNSDGYNPGTPEQEEFDHYLAMHDDLPGHRG